MTINDHTIDQAYSDLKDVCGGVRNGYFSLLYLQREFGLDRQDAIAQVAFSGNDYGLDAFHLDGLKRNLYLLQFNYSESYAQFKQSFQRLAEDDIGRMFGAATQDKKQNQLV